MHLYNGTGVHMGEFSPSIKTASNVTYPIWNITRDILNTQNITKVRYIL